MLILKQVETCYTIVLGSCVVGKIMALKFIYLIKNTSIVYLSFVNDTIEKHQSGDSILA